MSALILKREVFTSVIIFGTYYTIDIIKLLFFDQKGLPLTPHCGLPAPSSYVR